MPRVAQKLQPVSTIVGSITTRLRNFEMQVANNDIESAAEDLFLIERKVRQLRKHVNMDEDDTVEATKPQPVKKSA